MYPTFTTHLSSPLICVKPNLHFTHKAFPHIMYHTYTYTPTHQFSHTYNLGHTPPYQSLNTYHTYPSQRTALTPPPHYLSHLTYTIDPKTIPQLRIFT